LPGTVPWYTQKKKEARPVVPLRQKKRPGQRLSNSMNILKPVQKKACEVQNPPDSKV
jgi:hypothetical protein